MGSVTSARTEPGTRVRTDCTMPRDQQRSGVPQGSDLHATMKCATTGITPDSIRNQARKLFLPPPPWRDHAHGASPFPLYDHSFMARSPWAPALSGHQGSSKMWVRASGSWVHPGPSHSLQRTRGTARVEDSVALAAVPWSQVWAGCI